MHRRIFTGVCALAFVVWSDSAKAQVGPQPNQQQLSALCRAALTTGGIMPIDCPQVCGGISGATCSAGEFCEFPIGSCDIQDRQGLCETIPLVCPDNVEPVCGCDGVTYGNACEADAVGASIAHVGACDSTFVNWENGHVHPLDLTPDGTRLLAVNTADNRLEVFDTSTPTPTHIGSIPVGLDPVSVRSFGDDTAWVVNHISDTISVVDLNAMNVVATVDTEDEPADVV
ncbi:MAG: hypothetical protein GXP29_01855, partial [Planctomycetes bacterium]|nr:hypothetical protein [Planctomycetota bacterium]